MALICDTGPIFAALDSDDADHASCARLLTEADEVLVVPAPVVVEVDWLASSRLAPSAFRAFLSDIDGGRLQVADLLRVDYSRIDQLLGRYKDLSLGFVDAAVLAIVERLGERRLATLDHRHFAVLRPRHVESLQLVP